MLGRGRELSRRAFVKTGVVSGAMTVVGRGPSGPIERGARAVAPVQGGGFELEEATIAQLGEWMRAGRYTARQLVDLYAARIEALDGQLHSVLEMNPDARSIADQLDADRRAGRVRGLLHGIPVLIKDNIDTGDRMHTSAGSLALAESIAPRDSFIAERLRAAGAVILGKTNLSEWANIRSTHSSSGWSGRGGQCHNPYALDRSPSGSSSGSGTAAAASLCAIAIGTETDGSITSPSAAASLVGIKPTVGLWSRSGIIPISHTQDTPGPMARTVADAAALLGALTGVDPRDPATAPSANRSADYTRSLDPDGLRRMRIGVARKRYTGYSGAVDGLFNAALAVLRDRGAVIVDPADVTTEDTIGNAELTVLLYELKADLNMYLAALGPNAPVKTLADVIAFDQRNSDREMPYFRQELFERAQAKGPLTALEYRTALARCRRTSRILGIDATMTRGRLDAIVCPTQAPVWPIDHVNGDAFGGNCTTPAAVAGYPHITVPMGYVFGLPVGLSFFGRAWSEASLIKVAFAYEQATKLRRPPRLLSTVEA